MLSVRVVIQGELQRSASSAIRSQQINILRWHVQRLQLPTHADAQLHSYATSRTTSPHNSIASDAFVQHRPGSSPSSVLGRPSSSSLGRSNSSVLEAPLSRHHAGSPAASNSAAASVPPGGHWLGSGEMFAAGSRVSASSVRRAAFTSMFLLPTIANTACELTAQISAQLRSDAVEPGPEEPGQEELSRGQDGSSLFDLAALAEGAERWHRQAPVRAACGPSNWDRISIRGSESLLHNNSLRNELHGQQLGSASQTRDARDIPSDLDVSSESLVSHSLRNELFVPHLVPVPPAQARDGPADLNLGSKLSRDCLLRNELSASLLIPGSQAPLFLAPRHSGTRAERDSSNGGSPADPDTGSQLVRKYSLRYELLEPCLVSVAGDGVQSCDHATEDAARAAAFDAAFATVAAAATAAQEDGSLPSWELFQPSQSDALARTVQVTLLTSTDVDISDFVKDPVYDIRGDHPRNICLLG